jgi:hypothetical protein
MIARYGISLYLTKEEKEKVEKLKDRGYGSTDIFRMGLERQYKQIFGKEK